VGNKQHYIVGVSTRSMIESVPSSSPIIFATRVDEYTTDVHWLQADTILAATGRGNLQLFRRAHPVGSTAPAAPGATCKFTHIGTISDVHSAEIREVAFNPYAVHQIATIGEDRKLTLIDLHTASFGSSMLTGTDAAAVTKSLASSPTLAPTPSHPTASNSVVLPENGGMGTSCKWTTFSAGPSAGSLVGVTQNEGIVSLFDAKKSLNTPAIRIDAKKSDLYTMCNYNGTNLLLGFGDGELQHFDIRTGSLLARVQDPYCEAVGNIVSNEIGRSRSFVVSGTTDFTVWHHSSANSEARAWSHGQPSSGSFFNRSNYAIHAVLARDDALTIAADTVGHVKLFEQRFAV